jgi:aminoglycoside phosphotransferase (APT) family kinase protein
MSALAMSESDRTDWGRLAEVLRARGLIGAHALKATRLTGGQSNPTFRLDAGDRRYVLRKKPAGQLLASAHAIDREYRVLDALRDSDVPVPKVYCYSDDSSVVGTPFYIMEFLDGRVWSDQSLPGLTGAERAAVYAEMNRVIAAMHRMDPDAVGLSDFGRTGNYFQRQIARWTRQYGDSRTGDIAAMDALTEWLPQCIPPGDETAIVHGDYRLDNLVFHPTQAQIIGVLDWELSTLGHPMADFAYHCMSWHIPADLWRGIGGLDLQALGIPSSTEYLRRYCDRTGAQTLEHWDFYLAFNFFRIAAILQGIAKRALDGSAAASDAAETGRKAAPLAALGWQCAQRYDASRR